jgi:hypothetical protein
VIIASGGHADKRERDGAKLTSLARDQIKNNCRAIENLFQSRAFEATLERNDG